MNGRSREVTLTASRANPFDCAEGLRDDEGFDREVVTDRTDHSGVLN